MDKPNIKPENPNFSSGPCAKRPKWSLKFLNTSILGRSHRAKKPKDFINYSVELTSDLLEIPKDYKVAIVPASDTGAFEMAMWNFLGHIPVDVFAWESFGKGWVTDIIKQLGLEDANVIEADYGILPDLQSANSDNDIVFTLNGTTSGVRVPNLNWIKDSRKGITLCDATSGLFAQKVDWGKLDVTTFSWQKVLGGEAQHGMIILSPKAIDRLNQFMISTKVQPYAEYPMSKIAGDNMDKATDVFAKMINANNKEIIIGGSTSINLYVLSNALKYSIKPGDEVITQAFNFIATVEAIVDVGAKPIIVNVDDTLNMNVEDLKKAITPRTKVILPVHMLGVPANIGSIMKFAKAKKIKVLEDNCESVGAKFNKKYLGTIGHIGVLSFDFGKVITTGEGGMIVFKNKLGVVSGPVSYTHLTLPTNREV